MMTSNETASHLLPDFSDPPENLTLSNKVVSVVEGNIPEKVLCHAKAFPEASYQWRREGESDVIVKGNALILNHPVGKRNGGNYTCEAYNRHGNNSLTTFINVLCKNLLYWQAPVMDAFLAFSHLEKPF